MFEEKVPCSQGKLLFLPLKDSHLRGPFFPLCTCFSWVMFSAISIDTAQQLTNSKGTFTKSDPEGSSS